MPAKTTMARMKLATGPAATTAARFQTGWAKNETARSLSGILRAAVSSVPPAAVASPWNFT